MRKKGGPVLRTGREEGQVASRKEGDEHVPPGIDAKKFQITVAPLASFESDRKFKKKKKKAVLYVIDPGLVRYST